MAFRYNYHISRIPDSLSGTTLVFPETLNMAFRYNNYHTSRIPDWLSGTTLVFPENPEHGFKVQLSYFWKP
jgi:hypothetical protein